MNKPALFVAMAFILCGSIEAYFYWQHSQPKPEPVQHLSLPLPVKKQEVRHIVEEPVPLPQLPALAESDSFFLDLLAGLVGNITLMKLFHTERVIHNIVATIDNLPSVDAPMKVMPLVQAQGEFATSGTESKLTISPRNAVRYKPYMKVAGAIDARRLVELYVRLYPLFQQAYEDLGYPKKYFNDRLIEVLDNLLDAPDVNDPVGLVQPHVLYLFADPDLEGRSIGQKILIRIGRQNSALIKSRLREIKHELKLHMHEKKLESTG